MDSIFHEEQEGSLCAQHCLNSLLQGPYFSAVDLASIAQDLDDAERARMAEGGVDSAEYLRFQEQPSSNMDDSGFFSVQVISKALSVWGLQSIPIGSAEAGTAATHPQKERAFICNFREHWLTIRKLGNQWFNLNSLLTGPELISDTYLSMFLAQLQKEGYSIFVTRGNLPDSEADQLLCLIPAVQTERPKLLSELAQSSSSTGAAVTPDDLQRALEASRNALGQSQGQNESELQAAIRMSLQGEGSASSGETKPVNADEVRRKREAFFNRQDAAAQSQSSAIQPPASSQVPACSSPSSSFQPAHAKDHPTPQTKENNSNNSAQTWAQSPCADVTREETGEEPIVAMAPASDEDMTETAMLEAAIRMSMETVEQTT